MSEVGHCIAFAETSPVEGFVYQKDAEAYLQKLKRSDKNGEKIAARSYLCDDCGYGILPAGFIR